MFACMASTLLGDVVGASFDRESARTTCCSRDIDSLIGHARVLHVRDRLIEIRLRLPRLATACATLRVLLQMLVNLRVRFRQQLSGAHAVANVA